MKIIKIVIVIISLCFGYIQVNAQLKVISNGNVGVFTSSPSEAFQIGDRWTFHNGGTKVIGYNFHYNAGDKRLVTDYANCIRMDFTGIRFGVATTGSAGSAISWTIPFEIKTNGYAYFGSYYVYNGAFRLSDVRLKENIKPITNATNLLMGLNGMTYNLKSDKFKSTVVSKRTSYGLIAQDVQKIIPDLVLETDDSTKTLAIDYEGLIPILIEALKEQQAQVKELKSSIENLNSQISLLKEKSVSYMNQNSPNPFNNYTQISFSLPKDTKEASIMVYNSKGKLIKNIKITDRGNSNITLDATNLKPGVYSYSLIADGAIINTSKMIISK